MSLAIDASGGTTARSAAATPPVLSRSRRVAAKTASGSMPNRSWAESKLGYASASKSTVAQVEKDGARLTKNVATRELGQAVKTFGKVARPVGLAIDAVEVGSAIKAVGGKFGDHTQHAVGSLAGGAAGAWAGAEAGAAIGTFAGPVAPWSAVRWARRPELCDFHTWEPSDRAGAHIVYSLMGDIAMLFADVLLRAKPGRFVGMDLDRTIATRPASADPACWG